MWGCEAPRPYLVLLMDQLSVLRARRRPTYFVTCDDSSEHETSDEHIFSLPEPKSELLPNVASPPTILAPPPAPTPPPTPGSGNPGVDPGHRPDLAAPPPTAGVKAGAHDAALPPPFAASRPPAGEASV